MDSEAAGPIVALFEGRGQLARLEHVDSAAACVCLSRTSERLRAATVLADAELWEAAFTTAFAR